MCCMLNGSPRPGDCARGVLKERVSYADEEGYGGFRADSAVGVEERLA